MKLVVFGILGLLILAGIIALLEKGMRDEDRIRDEEARIAEEARRDPATAERIARAEIDRFADEWEQDHGSEPY